jgi:hypothetical protein
MEPVAKDGGANLFLNVSGDVHIHNHYNSQQANAVQNSARRFLGNPLPTNEVHHDQLLSLYQVRGDISAKVGDRGIIEAISPHSDIEAKATEGKVRLYRILAVKDVLDRD